MEIVVDAHERYAYRFPAQQVRTVTRALPCGDYGVTLAGTLVASVERKSLSDLVASLINGRLRFALAELAALPRAAVVVEDRYSQVFALERVRPSVIADGLAELQVRWPNVPIVFCENRKLAEEWTYRYLAAARTELGTDTIKQTVNEALRRATQDRGRRVAAALDILANADLDDRVEAWR
jgi:ERCC4-type nuclease